MSATRVRRLRVAGEANGKLAEVVAQRIEDDIVARGWPVGAVLGSEARLLRRYRVSRSALREAVRLLEHHQIATMRPGPGGGLVVMAPDSAALTRALGLYLEYRKADIGQIMEAKRALELTCVRLATERIDEEGVARLRRGVEREKSTPKGHHLEIGEHNVHIIIAELTGNPAMRVFVETLTRFTAQHTTTKEANRGARRGYELHARIAEAIIAGDAPLASHLMSRHLDKLAADLR